MNTRRFIRILVGIAVFAGLVGGLAYTMARPPAAQAQSAVDNFNPGANWQVSILLIQPDGKILIAGSFTELAGQPCEGFGRLNADGSLDTSFNPGTAHRITALALQPDGKILVGGRSRKTLGEDPHAYIERLNADGSLDASFSRQMPQIKGMYSSVLDLIVQPDGRILLAGVFDTLAGGATRNIGRLNPDGSLDTSFQSTLDDHAYLTDMELQPDGKIIIGGGLGTWDTSTCGEEDACVRDSVIRLNEDGTRDSSFQSPVTRLPWGANSTPVTDMALQPDGKVVVVGQVDMVAGQKWIGPMRLDTNGHLDETFKPDVMVRGPIIVQPDGKLLMGNSVSPGALFHLNSNGSLDRDFEPLVIDDSERNSEILVMAVRPDGKILIGGDFDSVCGQPRDNIALIDSDGVCVSDPGGLTVDAVDESFKPEVNGAVYATAVQPDGRIVIGGDFTAVAGQPRQHIAWLKPDANLDDTCNPGADGIVYTLAVQPGDSKLLVGGDFTQLGGQPFNRIGRLDSNACSPDVTFNPGTGANGPIRSLAIQSDGKIVVGGSFGELNGQLRQNIGWLNADGSVAGVPVLVDAGGTVPADCPATAFLYLACPTGDSGGPCNIFESGGTGAGYYVGYVKDVVLTSSAETMCHYVGQICYSGAHYSGEVCNSGDTMPFSSKRTHYLW